MSEAKSGGSTPASNFVSRAQSDEETLKEQTLGLVQLHDFRKRRIETLEKVDEDEPLLQQNEVLKSNTIKRKKASKKGALSFGVDQDEESINGLGSRPTARDASLSGSDVKRKMKPNAGVSILPKSQSKSALAREEELKTALKKEYLQMQEAVRAAEFMLPFVFFDGKDRIGGKVRMKKGDPVWLFLERARKVGAVTAGAANISRKDWARISVDDLMLVKDDLIIPPHFDFHYFTLNQAKGYRGMLFNLSSNAAIASPTDFLNAGSEHSSARTGDPSRNAAPSAADEDLEGFSDDPAATRVVDRRWYEKNKHIYPASLWEDFDAQRDYSKGGRKDREGNQMFFT